MSGCVHGFKKDWLEFCRHFLGLMNDGLPHFEHLTLTPCLDALSHKALTAVQLGLGGL